MSTTASWLDNVYTYDNCLPIKIPVEKDFWDTDKTSIAIAFVVAAVVGALIALGCAKLCMKDITKYRSQDAERAYKTKIENGYQTSTKAQKSPPRKRSKSLKKRMQSAKGKKDQQLVPVLQVTLDNPNPDVSEGVEERRGVEEESPAVLGSTDGMVDTLNQPSLPELEEELSKQDLHGILNLEKDLREETINMMINILRTALNQKLSKGKITPEQFKEQVTTLQNNIDETIRTNQNEQEAEKEELRKRIKDPTKLQEEIDNLHPKYVARLNSALKKECENVRSELEKGTELNEAQIEAMMAKYADTMALLERKLAIERARQVASLDEKLAKRRVMGEYQMKEKLNRSREVENLHHTYEPAFQKLVDDGKLMDRQKNEILNQYEQDLSRLMMRQEEDLQRQQLSLAEKLKMRRRARTQELKEAQEEERDSFLQKIDAFTNTTEFMEEYHYMLEQQRNQEEDLSDQLDNSEFEEMKNLGKRFENNQHDEIDRANENLLEQLQNKTQLSQRDLEYAIRMHEDEMRELQRIKAAEKKNSKARLEEELAQRRLKAEEDQKRSLMEQQALNEQQESTINKLLNSQIEISDAARDKILKEHENNMTAVNNQLQMSRLRQQKMLEQKLSKRKAKIGELQRQREEAASEKKVMKEKERNKLKAQLDKQIDEEEKRLAEERSSAVANLKKSLQEETEQALKDQAQHVSMLIARLQVGQARRQAIIQKQDGKIKDLEERIANRVGETGDGENPAIDHLLQQHYNQVANLNDKLQDTRERQEHMLREKLERKKLQKGREIEQNLESEAQRDWTRQKERGAGMATNILSQVMLEQRHKNAMQQLEREMQAEMQNQRDELNSQLEAELNHELDEQKKNFLAQIAQTTRITDDEVDDLLGTSQRRRGSAKSRGKSASLRR